MSILKKNFESIKKQSAIKKVEKSRISGSSFPGYKFNFLKIKPVRKHREIIK